MVILVPIVIITSVGMSAIDSSYFIFFISALCPFFIPYSLHLMSPTIAPRLAGVSDVDIHIVNRIPDFRRYVGTVCNFASK